MADSTEQKEVLSRTLAGGSDIVFDFTCQPCSGDNKTLEAVGFCVDCSEFLCDECYKYHIRPTLMRNHKLLDIEEVKKNNQDICTEKCPQHRGEIVKYVCFDHDILGCGACMNVEHKSCPGVKCIPDIAEAMVNSDEYSGLIGELDNVLLRTTCLISKSTENKAKSQSHCDKILTDMDQIKKEFIEAFNKLVKAVKAEAENIKLKETQTMDANIVVFDKIQHKSVALALKLKSMKDTGQFCKLCVAMIKEKRDIMSMNDELNQAAHDNDTDVSIAQTSVLEELIKYKDSLGKLGQRVGVKSKATQVGEIRVRTDSDTGTCNIWGLVSLPGGRLVAADTNNKKLKLVDEEQTKVIFELKLQGGPQDITLTDKNNEIAITIPSKSKLILVKISGDTLLMHREIKTSSCCYGVASFMDNLVVSLSSPERLEIIDKNGNVLRKIVNDENGTQLFSDVRSLAVSKDIGTIYAPDWNKNTVTCLSLSGKVHAVYKDSDLESPKCVAVDGRGNVYIGGTESKNVHQITPDCKKISILLSQKDGIGGVCEVCYCTETDCLYVGHYSDTLLTFQLS